MRQGRGRRRSCRRGDCCVSTLTCAHRPTDPSRPGVVLHSLIALSEPQFHTLWNMMRLIRDYCNSVAGTQSGETSAMVDVVAPILCRPAHAAFMSVKHMKQLQVIQQCVWQLLDEQDTLFARAHRTRARAAAEAEAAAAAGAAGPLHISPTNASGSDGDGNGSPTRSPAKLMIRVASSNFVPDRDVAAAEQALGGAVGLLLRGEVRTGRAFPRCAFARSAFVRRAFFRRAFVRRAFVRRAFVRRTFPRRAFAHRA